MLSELSVDYITAITTCQDKLTCNIWIFMLLRQKDRKGITRYILKEEKENGKISKISNSVDILCIYKRVKNPTIFCVC